MSEPKLQSSLGAVQEISTKNQRTGSMGYLAFGKILKVHHKRYTADVQIYGTNDVIKSSSAVEGQYACKIGVSNAGIDSVYKKPFGEIVPIQKGAIVLVGFLRNSKEKPVILRVFHESTEPVGQVNYNNILTSFYPVTDDTEINRYLRVNRIQDFLTVDGSGNIEVSSHTKSFLVGINNKEIDEENFDYEDLSIKDQQQKTIHVEETDSKPMKWLAVFRSAFSDTAYNCLRVIVDTAKSSFKLAKQQRMENKLSFIEIDQNGAITLRRQLDTVNFDGSNNFAEIGITAEGDVSVTKGTTTIVVTDSGVNISSLSDINIVGKSLNITGEATLNGKRIAKQGDSTSEGGHII